jgi:hypothetical protein
MNAHGFHVPALTFDWPSVSRSFGQLSSMIGMKHQRSISGGDASTGVGAAVTDSSTETGATPIKHRFFGFRQRERPAAVASATSTSFPE